MSRIELNVVATGNFRNLETSLTRLRTQVNALNAAFVGGRGGAAVLTQVDGYIKGFENAIDASGMFERHMVNITSETTKFGRSLESGTMRMGGLFRAAVEYRRGELGQIRQLAREQIRLQNSTVMRMPDGRAQVIVPRGIDEGIEKQRILNQEYRIFRQVVQNGSTEIINWGKNTQWAGRQLTVGLTVPLTMFGAAAGKMFLDADKQLVRLAKVYGDATKGMVDEKELDGIRKQTLELGQELAKTMGVAASETMGIAADLAATGKEGNELLGSTREAIRLSVLGEVDRQEAMRATLSIQNVFKKDTEGLAESINFLNAVENQTSTSLNDLVEGIVKAGPVVQGLGGDMEDLALMMVAMREGGIPAAEAANAIKSSMASLINPTKQTTQLLNGFGIDLIGIVDKNAGDVTGTLKDLQTELDGLNELSRQRAIEQIFGKFQFSRINALLNNIGRAGSQTQQVMAIAGMTTTELAETADQELTAMTESISGKFGRAVETLKANLIPIGEAFVQVGTFLLNVGNKVLEVFNMIPEPIQNVVKGLMFLTALAGPVIMITGVLGNFFGYIVKGISSFMAFKKAGRGMFEVFTPESIAAKSATESLTDSLFDQKVAMGDMAVAVTTLVEKLETLVEQLHEVGAASSNFDKVGAKAEAQIMAAGSQTGYTSPDKPFMKRPGQGGIKRPNLTYSHLTPTAQMKGLLGEGYDAKRVMGMGTYVTGPAAAEVNRMLGDFLPDVTSIREATVTDQSRREMLMQYGMSQGLAGTELDKLAAQIDQMTSQELAQMLPSWEKISLQHSQYVGTLKGVQEGLASSNEIIQSTTEQALADYRSDVLEFGPEEALRNLQAKLKELGINVDTHINGVADKLESIRSDVSQLPEAERPRALVQAVTERVTKVDEYPAAQALQQVEGFGGEARKSYMETIMYGAQAMTDGMIETGMISEELGNALKASVNANTEYQKSLVDVEDAQRKLDKSSEKLTQANNNLAQKLDSMNIEDDFYQDKSGAWKYGSGEKVQDDELKKLLSARKRALNAETAASEELTQVTEASTQAQENLNQANIQLEAQKKKEVQQSEENVVSDEREQAATENLTNAENIDAQQTLESANAEEEDAQASLNNANAENLDASSTNKGRGGILRGGRLGMAVSALSMAGMMIPTGDADSGIAQGLSAAQDIGMFAGMGAMFGPPGIAAGAGIGALKAGFELLARKSEETAKSIEEMKRQAEVASTGLLDLEKSFFDVRKLSDVEDLQLDAFKLRTEEATSRLEEFSKALSEAEEGTREKSRLDYIASLESGENFVNSTMFRQMLSEALLGGMSQEDIRTMFAGYLDASGQQDFSGYVVDELERVFDLGDNPEEIGRKYIAGLQDLSDRVLEEAGYSASQAGGIRSAYLSYEQARSAGAREAPATIQLIQNGVATDADVADLTKFLSDRVSALGGNAEDFFRYLRGEAPTDPNMIRPTALYGKIIQDMRQGETLSIDGEAAYKNQEVLDGLLAASAELVALQPDMANIQQTMDAIGDSSMIMADGIIDSLARGGEEFDLFLNEIGQYGRDSINENAAITEELVNRITKQSPKAAEAFRMMKDSGIETTDALRIARMVISDLDTDWRALADMARANPAQFRAEVWTTYLEGGSVSPPTAQGATLPEDVGGRLSGTIDWSGGSASGGGSPDTSAIDAQIEAQDELIEKIKEEREERQKLLNLQKEALDFAIRRQDLENQIARARAEGDFAQAALLQAQLDAAVADERASEVERRRQEQEDRRIKAAEKEKERLQEQKDAMSGGGSSGGGSSEGPSKAQQEWTANRINILTSGVVNWTEGAQLRAMTLEKGPWSAFFESDKVRKYREELAKLGVPAEEVDGILNEMFESWIDNNSELFAQTEEYKFIKDQLGELRLGAEGVKEILPEAFSVLLDKELGRSEKIDILTEQIYDLGFEQDDARRKAQKLYGFYEENDFETEGIDDEIQKWIDFNDGIDRAKNLIKEWNEAGTAGGISADAAERVSMQAAGQTPGAYGRQINAGGVMINSGELGEDLSAGLAQGMADGLQSQEGLIVSTANKIVDIVRRVLKTQSPSEVFKDIGRDVTAGLAEGMSEDNEYREIEDSFSSMVEGLKNIIVGGFEEVPSDITPSIENAGDTFYNIMTTRIQETADKISDILQTSLPGHSFDIVGTPKIYVASGTDSIWSSVLGPSFNSLEITRVPPAFAEGGKVVGPGGPTEDRILAQLSDGEYVVKAAAVKQYGVDFLDTLNAQKYAVGGYVSADRAEREAQNRTVSNNTANQVGGYAGQAMRQPYRGVSTSQSSNTSSGLSFSPASWDQKYSRSNAASTARWNAMALENISKPQFYSPSFSEEVSGMWQGARSGLATLIDSFNQIIPPFMRNNSHRTTSLGRFVGGTEYNSMSMSERLALAMSVIPIGRGAGGQKSVDFSRGPAFWQVDGPEDIRYFVSSDPSGGTNPGAMVTVTRPQTKYSYPLDEMNVIGGTPYNFFGEIDWDKIAPENIYYGHQPGYRVNRVSEDGLKRTVAGEGPDGQLSLFDVAHTSPELTFVATNPDYSAYVMSLLTNSALSTRIRFGETLFSSPNLSSHSSPIVDRLTGSELFRSPPYTMPNSLNKKNFTNYSVPDPSSITNGVISQTYPEDMRFFSLLARQSLRRPSASDSSIFLDTFNRLPGLAFGGMISKYANGGLVRLNKSEMSILGKEMTDYASQFVGTPYSPNSFSSQTGPNTGDEGWGCATAMEWLYNNKAGMSLGNKSLSWGQYQTPPGKFISEGKKKLPGDLLYFYYPNGVNTQNPINHTGMYMGQDTMFHAQNPAAGTNITGIDSDNLYTKGPYAKRVLPETIAGMGIPTGRFKMGGKVYGNGGPTADNLLAWLSNGEYVMSADTVKHYGQDFMDALNSMDLSEFSSGGFASKYPGVVAKMDSGGGIRSVFGLKNSSDSISNIEYNINVNVEGTNASPDDIAQAVMKSMKRKERMSGAVTRI